MGPTGTYGFRWQFPFYGENGTEYLINIRQKNYSGSSVIRNLGQAPKLKRESGGVICGTSLEIYAEAQVDGEFAALYTSDAREFYVELLYKNGSTWTGIWRGFVNPELYSEPDIAPPYDVQIIATDGLGELKNYDFPANGRQTLYTHIKTCLDNTGLITNAADVTIMNGIYHSSAPAITVSDILSAKVNLDHLAEGSCYEALEGIVSSLNAMLTYDMAEDVWVIVRMNDLGRDGYDASGNAVQFDYEGFGSMGSNDYWPVGQLSVEMLAAKNKAATVLPYHAGKSMLSNADLSSNSQWTISGSVAWSSTGLKNGISRPRISAIYLESSMQQNIAVEATAATMRLSTGLLSTHENGTKGADGYIQISLSTGSTTYYLKSEDGEYAWKTAPYSINFALGASDLPADLSAFTENIIDIPGIPYDGTLTIKYGYDGGYQYGPDERFCVGWAYLTQAITPGYRDTVLSGNDARDDAEDVTISYGDTTGAPNDIANVTNIISFGSSDALTGANWHHSRMTGAHSFLELIAIDRAVESYAPRLKYKGTLNVGTAVPPILFTRDSLSFFCKTMEWNLLDSEMGCELEQKSTATGVTVTSSTIVEIAESGTSSGSSSSGGGGGGGTSDYDQLSNRPQINSHTLTGNQTADDLGLGTYSKPSGGIPATDLVSGVQAKLELAGHLSEDSNRLIITGAQGVVLYDDNAGASMHFRDGVLWSDTGADLGKYDEMFTSLYILHIYFARISNVNKGFSWNSGGYLECNVPFETLQLKDNGNVEETPEISFIDIAEEEETAEKHCFSFNFGAEFDGDVVADNINVSSDRRLKENIEDIDAEDAADVLEELRPVDFDWKASGEEAHGFIAQEVEEILPELVKAKSDGNLALNYTGIIAYLVKGWQEHERRIDELEKQIEILTKK